MKGLSSFLFLLFFGHLVFAQGGFESGWIPKLNVQAKFSDQIKWNNSIRSRQRFSSREEDDLINYKYVLTDFTTILSTTIRGNKSLNAGYMLRLREGSLIHRLIQQFNVTNRFDAIRMGQRLGIDQTFTEDKSFVFRMRYRLNIEKALQGDKVDSKEFYFKIGNEYLGAFSSDVKSMEVRLTPQFGYQVNDRNKLEFGLDYRLGSIFSGPLSNDLWWNTVWYLSLDARKEK